MYTEMDKMLLKLQKPALRLADVAARPTGRGLGLPDSLRAGVSLASTLCGVSTVSILSVLSCGVSTVRLPRLAFAV